MNAGNKNVSITSSEFGVATIPTPKDPTNRQTAAKLIYFMED